MLGKSLAAVGAVALALASPAAADPDNDNTLTRTLTCDNGQTVETVFAGEAGSNFNVVGDTAVIVYKWLHIDRPPLGPSPEDETLVRGISGFDESDLVMCTYSTPSGNFNTLLGIYTPRS